VATWWPAAGLAVALVALAPRRWWPALAVGIVVFSGLANVTGGRDVPVSVLFGVSNAAEAVVAAAVLRRDGRDRPRLESLEDFVGLVVAALLGGATIATGAALTVVATDGGSFWESWRSVLASHAASTLVLVPVALAARSVVGPAPATVRPARHTEAALQALALVVVCGLVFSPGQSLPVTFIPLPFLVWAALRLDLRTVTWQLAAVSVAVTFLTAHGNGPFGASMSSGALDAVTAGLLTQLYLVCAAVMSLPLAIAAEQRGRLLHRTVASESLFRRNFTESLVGMLLLRCEDGDLRIVETNDTAARLLGSDQAALTGCSLAQVLDTAEPLDAVVARMLDGELDGWKAQTGLRGHGRARVNVALALITADPEPMFSVQLQDVTAEYDALRRAQAAEKLTSATLDTTACIILVTDLAGTIVRVNAATTRLTGFREDELLGRPVWDTSIAPATAADVDALFALPGGRSAPVVGESDVITRTGEKLHVVWSNNIVRDEEERPEYAVLTGLDVTAERATAGLMVHLLEAAITTALIGIEHRGRITVFNAGAQNLLGHHYLEMLGQPFVSILDADQLEARTGSRAGQAAFDAIAATIGPAGEARRDWTWVARDGRRHTISMTLSVTTDSTGSPLGFLCVGRDVTEQRQNQEMLVAALEKERTAVERLRKLDQAKNEFVSTVSHELRTPVTSIVGYTEMLQDGSIVEPAPGQRPLLDTIARNGQRLIDICSDLLLLSGLDKGAAQWDRETLDLTTVVAPAEEQLRPLLAGRDLRLRIESPDSPVPVLGDRAQLERVLVNLLSNAVKFTEDGGAIDCCLETVDGEAVITVRDTGIGIPEGEQGGLFEKFFRSSTAQARAIQGTGLGLSIVSAIVTAHGGHVGVRSAHMAGTTFTVRLPLRQRTRVG
jgi:PAS domain S-box-containing protein